MSFRHAYQAVKSQLPHKYNHLSKIHAELKWIKDLRGWRKFIVDIRKRETKKNIEKKNFLKACMEEMIKKNKGFAWISLIGGFNDVLKFSSLKNVRIYKCNWVMNISPSLTISRRFLAKDQLVFTRLYKQPQAMRNSTF